MTWKTRVGPVFQPGRRGHPKRVPLQSLLALAALTIAACTHRAAPPPFASWELRGTIVDVAGDHLRVRHKSGQVVDLVLDDRTTIAGREGTATRPTLTHGRRVVVSVEPLGDGRARAAHVRVLGG
jgi:hypothetical protein